jgi:hypothetical protein
MSTAQSAFSGVAVGNVSVRGAPEQPNSRAQIMTEVSSGKSFIFGVPDSLDSITNGH